LVDWTLNWFWYNKGKTITARLSMYLNKKVSKCRLRKSDFSLWQFWLPTGFTVFFKKTIKKTF
jgi:hypothetical protein